MSYRRIGIIGAGVIGQALCQEVIAVGAEIAYVLVSQGGAGGGSERRATLPPAISGLVTSDVAHAMTQAVDLVVEAAHPDVLARLGPRILESADLCGFSCSALARPKTEAEITRAAKASGRRFLLPHGAILGLDGLADGRDLLEQVVITTTKSDTGLGLPAGTTGTVFDGPTREACHRFPRNVNVHAAIAAAGIGFDRTRSVVIAEPGLSDMRHRIQVNGKGLAWDLSVSSRSLGGVSGAYTPRSASGSLRRLLGADWIAPI
jgi:aspartate dehydrogenase